MAAIRPHLKMLVAMALAAGSLVAMAGQAASATERSPLILFEQERAQQRGDRVMLRLGDDSSIIPANRIKALPIVDGRMGDRVVLDGGLQLSFPFGRIIQAQSEFQKYRVNGTGKAELNPLYTKVTTFDQALGPVCARADDVLGPGSRAEMRLGPNRTVTLVEVKPSTTAAPDDEHYRVVSGLEFRHIRNEPQAERLFTACNSAGPKPKILAKE